jgi:hypothetical protein
MNLRNKRDFCANHQMIQDTHAVFVPILKKQGLMLRELLEISNLWTLEDLKDMMVLCKQAKWSEGISIILQSKAMHRNFLAMHHIDQNIFLHDTVRLPYELLDSNEYELAQLDDDEKVAMLPVLKS